MPLGPFGDVTGGADAWPLACPLCGRPMRAQAGVLACSAGHSFDVAKDRYVNLLPPQHRTRGLEGDVLEMLRARRRFLDGGYYQPLRELVADVVEGALDDVEGQGAPAGRTCVLESGCGEGYYIGGVAERLVRRTGGREQRHFVVLGTDLSKSAVRTAAKRYRDVSFFVSDVNRRIYVETASVRVLVDIFAPRNPTEFARAIELEGRLVIVVPGESHLRGLREDLGLLGIEEDKEGRMLSQLAEWFELEDRRELAFPLELDAEAAGDLVTMGPSYWHRTGADPIGTGEVTFATEASFVALTFRRS